jgi:VWFA-related protein
MKRAILLLFLLPFTVSAFASGRVTVDQLSRIVASSHGKPDAKVADRLFQIELSERLSAEKLATLEATLPGPKSRRALVALADLSTFLDPPLAEIPTEPIPTLEQQRDMTARAADYAKMSLGRLPNLFARRDTIRFEDTPATVLPGGVSAPSGTFVQPEPMHPVSRSSARVLFRDGQEMVEEAGGEQTAAMQETSGLTTFGEFGSILSTIFSDLSHGNLAWSHWERGSKKPVAVFGFRVPRGASHYQIKFCCVFGRLFQQFPGYHGNITIDPTDGTILRLTLITDETRSDPIAKAELMVEYGSTVLGGKTYFCPVRSISVSLAPVKATQQTSLPGFAPSVGGGGQIGVDSLRASDSPMRTMLNEVVFDQYHLFQSEARLVTDVSAEGYAPLGAPENGAPSSVVAGTTSETRPTLSDKGEANKEETAPNLQGSVAAGPSTAVVVTAPAVRHTGNTNPEMSVATVADFPQLAGEPRGEGSGSKFSLHVSTRLVDVGVTAYDKKGRPVTDLMRDDFVVYDNDKKQNIRSFSSASTISVGSSPSTIAMAPASYSNRMDAMAGAQAGAMVAPETSTVVLLDATSLSFADLSHAREQILRYLEKLPSTEPVTLYTRAGRGFHVLAERTSNHASVSSALRGWMPHVQDTARAQEAEMRNRQQFDTVESVGDMQYVNGNTAGAPIVSSMMDIQGAGLGTTPDPKLMKEGSDPTRDSLTVLAAIAVHLGATPGNKNLVWVASDNVLADWSDKAVGVDRGAQGIGNFGIRVQEAMNDAHVSLYPMDASQLETSATDASLQNASVKLDPGSRDASTNASLGDATARPGARITAAMQQDLHPVQGGVVRIAEATGGRTFQRSTSMEASLRGVTESGRAAYRLSFAPEMAPDDRYHRLTVEVPGRRGVTLRYRGGYLYRKEPSTLKDRFRESIWQPVDASEIALSAHRAAASGGGAISLEIAAPDIGLELKDNRWIGKIDIFLVERDDSGLRAVLKGQTLALNLTATTYQKVMRTGIPFEQYIDSNRSSGTVRIIVVDESSGRMGSITLPAVADIATP